MTTTSIAKRISPMLLTANMEETILFYQNVPGFKTNHEIGGVLDWETGWPNHPFSEGRIRGGYEVCPRFGNGPCRFSHAPTRSIRCNSRRPRRTVRRSMRARYQRLRAHRQHRKVKLSPGCALMSLFHARSRHARSQVLRQRRLRISKYGSCPVRACVTSRSTGNFRLNIKVLPTADHRGSPRIGLVCACGPAVLPSH
jgi:hypothetical protein